MAGQQSDGQKKAAPRLPRRTFHNPIQSLSRPGCGCHSYGNKTFCGGGEGHGRFSWLSIGLALGEQGSGNTNGQAKSTDLQGHSGAQPMDPDLMKGLMGKLNNVSSLSGHGASCSDLSPTQGKVLRSVEALVRKQPVQLFLQFLLPLPGDLHNLADPVWLELLHALPDIDGDANFGSALVPDDVKKSHGRWRAGAPKKCPPRDLNPHNRSHWYLKPARLPIPPGGHVC